MASQVRLEWHPILSKRESPGQCSLARSSAGRDYSPGRLSTLVFVMVDTTVLVSCSVETLVTVVAGRVVTLVIVLGAAVACEEH